MSDVWPSRHGVQWLVSVALLVALILTLPSLGGAGLAHAQIGVPGLFTCSDGSQSFSGCGGAGIGYCGGSLGLGQACSGPGVGTASPGCMGSVCAPLATNACQGGVSVRPGQACGPNGITYPFGVQVPASQGCAAAYPGCSASGPLSAGVAASSGYTYSPLNIIYAPAWYGTTAGSVAPYAGASWKPCTVQGRGFVWLPSGVAAPLGSLC